MATRSELLQRRFIAFGVSASELTRRIPRDLAGQNLARQIVRSATSPAASYAEAREAESQNDYVHKMKLCLKELRETQVWLEMAEAIGAGRPGALPLTQECNGLISICVACLKTARSKERKPLVPRS